MSAVLKTEMKLHTADDLWQLAQRGGRYELIRGELVEMSPTGYLHGTATSQFGAYMQVYVNEQGLGECTAAESGYLIARNPDTVCAPDFAFVAQAYIPDPAPETFAAIVPTLVVETRSPNDARNEVAKKVREWLEARVQMVVEINPRKQVVTVHRAGEEPRELGINDIFDGEDVLPGFTLPVRRLFRSSDSKTNRAEQ